MKKHLIYSLCMSAALMAAACADDKGTDPAPDPNPDPVPEEYYAGGKLGTAFNTTSVAYEQPTPVVDDDAVMTQRFLNGEALFEKPFTANSSGVRYGLGPLYIRTSCLHCHPGYGHGKRIEGAFNTNQIGNGSAGHHRRGRQLPDIAHRYAANAGRGAVQSPDRRIEDHDRLAGVYRRVGQ